MRASAKSVYAHAGRFQFQTIGRRIYGDERKSDFGP